jgi:2-polyprenyl-3-methyl-5-hydroxy-6-metoxy-1,4-benzoquinol methylase
LPAALDLYKDEPARTRLHTAIRWYTCPFERIAEHVPATARDILELGCGHGLFAAHLALTRPHATVHGTDVDGDKIEAAQRAAARHTGNLTFAPSQPGEIPEGPWDAIAIVDVLYLIDEANQRDLVERAAGQLAPNGILLVKEMAHEPKWKFEWMKLQERISVKVLGITEGDELAFPKPADIERWMEQAGLRTQQYRLDRRYPHPHQLATGTRVMR